VAGRNLAGVKKKALTEGYRFIYIDEASISLASSPGYSYARMGKPPEIEINTDITNRLYLASGISETGDLIYRIRRKAFDGAAIVRFLKQLLSKISGKLLIVWDNASIHDCEKTRHFLATDEHANRLYLVKQPKYSPEVNADEQVWNQIKNKGLKNVLCKTIKELKAKVVREFERLKDKPKLIKQFFHHEEVGFYY
jgi:transposase